MDGLAIVADTGSRADAERAVAETVDRFGGLDALVLNAGSAESARYTTSTPDVFEEVLRANVTGDFLTARAAIPHLLRAPWRDRQHLLRLRLRAATESLAYCSSKAALARCPSPQRRHPGAGHRRPHPARAEAVGTNAVRPWSSAMHCVSIARAAFDEQ